MATHVTSPKFDWPSAAKRSAIVVLFILVYGYILTLDTSPMPAGGYSVEVVWTSYAVRYLGFAALAFIIARKGGYPHPIGWAVLTLTPIVPYIVVYLLVRKPYFVRSPKSKDTLEEDSTSNSR